MTNLTYSFTRRFSLAHRLWKGPSERCANIHGHDWHLTWEVCVGSSSQLNAHGMLLDFKSLKGAVHDWIDNYVDHSIALFNGDPLYKFLQETEPTHNLMTTYLPPTTEVLCEGFWLKIQNILPERCSLVKLVLQETPTNAVTMYSCVDDKSVFPAESWPHCKTNRIRD